MTHPRIRVILVCEKCGNGFSLMPSDAAKRMKNHHIFCSTKCFSDYRKRVIP